MAVFNSYFSLPEGNHMTVVFICTETSWYQTNIFSVRSNFLDVFADTPTNHVSKGCFPVNVKLMVDRFTEIAGKSPRPWRFLSEDDPKMVDYLMNILWILMNILFLVIIKYPSDSEYSMNTSVRSKSSGFIEAKRIGPTTMNHPTFSHPQFMHSYNLNLFDIFLENLLQFINWI